MIGPGLSRQEPVVFPPFFAKTAFIDVHLSVELVGLNCCFVRTTRADLLGRVDVS
jgi:hypothetical protein